MITPSWTALFQRETESELPGLSVGQSMNLPVGLTWTSCWEPLGTVELPVGLQIDGQISLNKGDDGLACDAEQTRRQKKLSWWPSEVCSVSSRP